MHKTKPVHNAQNLQNVWKDCTKKSTKPNLPAMRRTCKMFEKIGPKNAENQTCPQCADPAKCLKWLHQKMHKSKPVHNAQNLQNVWKDCTKKCRKPNLSTMRRTCKMFEKIAPKNAENQTCPQCVEPAKCLKSLHQKMQKSKSVHNPQKLQNVWKDCTKKFTKRNVSTFTLDATFQVRRRVTEKLPWFRKTCQKIKKWMSDS